MGLEFRVWERMCTTLKVHASASTDVLQFLARGRGRGGHIYQCKRGLTQVMMPKSRTSATSSVWTALCALVKLGGDSRMCSAAFALCRACDKRKRGANAVHQREAFGGWGGLNNSCGGSCPLASKD